jgi:hypothetical protein
MNHHDLLEGLDPALTLSFFATFARFEYALKRCSYLKTHAWPAPGSEDTELGVLMGPEVDHGEAEVHARVQA